MGPLKKIPEAADWLGISPETLQDWVAAGRVPFTTLAGQTADGKPSSRLVRFAQHHLDAIVAMGERGPVSAPAGLSPVATLPRQRGRRAV